MIKLECIVSWPYWLWYFKLKLFSADAFRIQIVWDRNTAVLTGAIALAGGLIGGYAGGRVGAAIGAGIGGATGLGVSSE